MTTQQKDAIQSMRLGGTSYTEIAEALDLSVNTVKSYGRRIEKQEAANTEIDGINRCKQCGVEYSQPEGRKPKLFCSDSCRSKWWNQNKAMQKTASLAACPGCGSDFMAVPNQKYCCRACYFRARYGGNQNAQTAV